MEKCNYKDDIKTIYIINMKKDKPTRKAPYQIRLADIYKEKLQKKADAKGIKLHKYVVQLLIKHAVK